MNEADVTATESTAKQNPADAGNGWHESGRMSVATADTMTVGTENLERLLSALIALKKGDFSVRLPVSWTGLQGKVADTFNDVIELNERMAAELERMSRVVGKEGKISQRASIGEVSGSWNASVS